MTLALRSSWWVLPLTIVLIATGASAQDEAPPSQFPIRPFALTNWGGDVFIDSHYQLDDESRSTHTRTQDMFFQEGLDLSLAGYAYHPNMFDWHTDLRLGLSQQDVAVNGDDHTSLGTLLGYNISALMFKEKPVTWRVYATRSQDMIDRSFGRAVNLTTETEGSALNLAGSFPGLLQYEHRVVSEKSDIRNDDLESHLVRFEIADARSRDFDSRLRFEHENVAETSTFLTPDGGVSSSLDLPDMRDELNFTNNYLFDGGAERLSGTVRLLNREGFFNEQLGSIEQRYDVTHSPTLSSFYRALASSDTTDAERTQIFQGETGVTKKIFDSLDISSRVLASDENFSDGGEERYEGYLDFDYRKRTPIGLYTSGLDLGLGFESDHFPQGIREIAFTPISLVGVAPTQLSQPNIFPGSIIVTDINHVVIPQGNYLVNNIGQFTELSRVPGGLIADGQPLLVSYSAAAGRDSQYITDIFDWRHRLALKGLPLAFYGEYRLRDQSLVGGDDPGTLENENELLGGAEVTLGPVILNGEYEYHTFRLTPSFNAYRFGATFVKTMSQRVNFTASARYEMLNYINPEAFNLAPGQDFLETYTANAGVNTKITQNLLLRTDAGYFHSAGRRNDSLARIGSALIYSRGKFDVSLNSSFGYFTQEQDHGVSVYVGVTVRRQF